jgi:Chromosome segregation ATPases
LYQLCASQQKALDAKSKIIAEKSSIGQQMNEAMASLKEVVRNTDSELSSLHNELQEKDRMIAELRLSNIDLKLTKERTEDQVLSMKRELIAVSRMITSQSQETRKLKNDMLSVKNENEILAIQLGQSEVKYEELLYKLKETTLKHQASEVESDRRVTVLDQKHSSQLKALTSQHQATQDELLAAKEKLACKEKLVASKEYQLADIKVRDKRVASLLVKLAESIKTQLATIENRKSCFVKLFKRPLIKNNSRSYLFDERYGMVQELLGEFIYVC